MNGCVSNSSTCNHFMVRLLLLSLMGVISMVLTNPLWASNNSEHSDAWIKEAVAKSGFNLSMINEQNFQSWMQFVEPTIEELDWNAVRWHNSLSSAAEEARRLNRPILLWTMNGHPFGET